MRAVAYLRASTDKQEASTAQQLAEIQEYCKEHDILIVDNIRDEGFSGTSSRRPGFKRLIWTCEHREGRGFPIPFDAVIIYDRSRWGRWLDHKDAVYWEQHLKHLGVELVAVKGNNGNDIGAHITQMIENHGASEYSRKLSSDVRRGSRHNAERGYWNGGRAPFGYARMVVDPATGQDVGILTPGERKSVKGHRVRLVLGDPNEVTVIRFIFELRAEGVTLEKIAKALKSDALSRDRLTWSKQQVGNILRNPVYTGSIQWSDNGGKYEGSGEITSKQAAHEAIIGGG